MVDIAVSEDTKKKRRKKKLLTGIVAAVALVLATIGIYSLEPAAPSIDGDAQWIVEVQRGSFLRAVRGSGTLVPEEIRWISAETDGSVEEEVVQPGARVEPDTVILRLSNTELEQQVADAGLELGVIEAQYTDLEIRLASEVLDQEATLAVIRSEQKSSVLQVEADRELRQSGLVPEIQLRRSELSVEQLTRRTEIEEERLTKKRESVTAQLRVKRTQVEQQQAIYDLRKRQLEDLNVKAGISGILQEVPVEIGQRVTAGTRLARVAQPDRLKAEVRIPETQAKDIQVGLTATIDTRNGIIEGRVARIDPAVQQGTVTVDVELPDELPKGARPDLSIDGTIELQKLEDVLYTGRPPYGRAYDTISLFLVSPDGKTAKRVQVELGATSVKNVEIVRGLKEGDRVILSDSNQWKDAEKLRLD